MLLQRCNINKLEYKYVWKEAGRVKWICCNINKLEYKYEKNREENIYEFVVI